MVVWLLLIITIVTAYFIQRLRFRWLPPSSSAMLLGIAAGGVSRLAGLAQPLRFSPAAFFYALLPPIVFQAGFALKKRVRPPRERGPAGDGGAARPQRIAAPCIQPGALTLLQRPCLACPPAQHPIPPPTGVLCQLGRHPYVRCAGHLCVRPRLWAGHLRSGAGGPGAAQPPGGVALRGVPGLRCGCVCVCVCGGGGGGARALSGGFF
jgi:hypothetical protein